MKQRSKLLTLVSLSSALDVKFSLFDALDEAEAQSAGRSHKRKPPVDHRHMTRGVLLNAPTR